MENLRARTGVSVFFIFAAIVMLLPNLMTVGDKWWLGNKKLNYGLDIQGGLHLVMGVDVAGVVGESSQRLSGVLKAELAKENISFADVKVVKPADGEIEISYADAAQGDAIAKYINSHSQYSTSLLIVTQTDKSMSLRYLETYLRDYKSKIIQQSIETIRNRIDEFGVAEPSISQQGADRILIQLPGMADAEKAKSLINTTAKLDFMIVADEETPVDLPKIIEDAEKAGGYNLENTKYSEYIKKLNADITAKLPAKTMVLFERSGNVKNIESGKIPYLVRTDTGLSGDALDDAGVSFDQYGVPEVSLRFNAVGAAKFKEVTGNNVGKRLAVVLDKVVKTAPMLKTAIGDGRAVITLGGSRGRDQLLDEAKMISTTLRAGALPASLEQLEERRVGPTLGSDSIKKAQFASLIGALIIFVFMVLRYKGMGLIADIALVINLICVFALLSTLGATLTLPGIAGIALTVGYAVDANVLINERMREEIHKGSSFTYAIKEGYHRAMSAILDANITTAATAVILLYFGTGPVKGFAVTLLIGIVTTLFANVFVSKWIVDILVHRFGFKKLSV